MKDWIEIKIELNSDIEDAVSNFLFEIGAEGNFTDNNVLTAYFKNSAWNEMLRETILSYLTELEQLKFSVSKNIEIKEIENKDWNALWKQSLEPIFILPELVVKPTWCEFTPSDENTLIVEIDPEMAFGTGAHATTQLMLKLMKPYLKDNQNILDVGTGAGLLAIVAAKWCKSRICAVDIDPIATPTARKNAIKNLVSENILFFTGSPETLKKNVFNLILANINRKEIIKLLYSIKSILKTGGVAIFSGILKEEEQLVVDELKKQDAQILKIVQQDEWIGIVTML